MPARCRRCIEEKIDASRDQVLVDRLRPFVWNVRQGDAAELPEQRRRDVLPRAIAGGCIRELAGIVPRVGHDLLECRLRQIVPRHERVAEAGGEAERGEIGFRVVRQAAVKTGRKNQIRRSAEQQCVAIGLRFSDEIGADDGAAARAILDDDRLAEERRQRLGERARHEVEAATGRLRHDDAQRFRRIGLCRRGGGYCEQRGGDEPQPQATFILAFGSG